MGGEIGKKGSLYSKVFHSCIGMKLYDFVVELIDEGGKNFLLVCHVSDSVDLSYESAVC